MGIEFQENFDCSSSSFKYLENLMEEVQKAQAVKLNFSLQQAQLVFNGLIKVNRHIQESCWSQAQFRSCVETMSFTEELSPGWGAHLSLPVESDFFFHYSQQITGTKMELRGPLYYAGVNYSLDIKDNKFSYNFFIDSLRKNFFFKRAINSCFQQNHKMTASL